MVEASARISIPYVKPSGTSLGRSKERSCVEYIAYYKGETQLLYKMRSAQSGSLPPDWQPTDGWPMYYRSSSSGSSAEVYIYIERGKNVLSQSQKRVPIVTTIYGAARKERDRSSLMNAYWIDVTSAGTQSWQSCRLETWWISFFFFFFKIWFDNDHVAGSGRSAHEPCWTYITYLS